MDHEERRGRVQQLLDDLRMQREVDPNEALMALIHFVFELDAELKLVDERLSRLESGAAAKA
jgi:hypothetical protein